MNIENTYLKFTLLLIGILITALVYSPGLPGSFKHDDHPNIVNNTHLHIDKLDSNSLISASFSLASGPLRRPVSMFSFAINHYFTQLDPLYFTIVNLAIHILTGLALFFLSRSILNAYRKLSNNKVTTNQVFYLSLFTSFAWLVSPINLTGVLYIVQRMTSLSALFSILGLYLYMVGRHSMIFKSKLNISAFIVSALFFIIAIFCKENGVLNIFYMLCIEVFVLRFSSNTVITKKYIKNIFFMLVILPTGIFILWMLQDSSYITKGYEHRSFTLIERVLTQFRAISFYLKMILIPNNTELGLFHDDFIISKSLLHPISTLVSISFLSLLVVFAFIKSRKYALFAFGIFFYLSSHILESTIFSLEIMYEHRNYIGSFGIIFAVVCTVYLSINKNANRKFALIVGCVWLSAVSFTTMSRASQWENSLSHAYYEALHHPKSSRANFYLGRSYAILSLLEFSDEKEKALQALENSMALSDTEISAETVAIRLASSMNIPAKPEWVDSIKTKISSNPIDHNTVGGFKELKKCLETVCAIDAEEVFSIYQVALNNEIPCPKIYRSDLLSLYAEFNAKHTGDLAVAYNSAKEAVILSPEILVYRINFIIILNTMGKLDEALEQIKYVKDNDKYKTYTNFFNEAASDRH